MSSFIKCPTCKTEIPLTEVIDRGELEAMMGSPRPAIELLEPPPAPLAERNAA